MILCVRCGYQNGDGDLFCTSCGSKLSEEDFVVGVLTLMGPSESARRYMLSTSDRHLGRAPSNDVVIQDQHVSGRHARVFYEEDAFWVEDLDSTNGTYVNGRKIEGRTRLRDADMIKVGGTILKFTL